MASWSNTFERHCASEASGRSHFCAFAIMRQAGAAISSAPAAPRKARAANLNALASPRQARAAISSATAAPRQPRAVILTAFAAPGHPQVAISSAATAPGEKILLHRSISKQKHEFCYAKTCKICFSEIQWKHHWENCKGSVGDQQC